MSWFYKKREKKNHDNLNKLIAKTQAKLAVFVTQEVLLRILFCFLIPVHIINTSVYFKWYGGRISVSGAVNVRNEQQAISNSHAHFGIFCHIFS